LAALEIADSRKARRKGLVGREGIDGALLLPSARLGVHSIGMRFPLDVAFCDRDLGRTLQVFRRDRVAGVEAPVARDVEEDAPAHHGRDRLHAHLLEAG